MVNQPKKLSLKAVKQLPAATLNRMINKAKKFLKNDETMQKIFQEYDEDVDIIDDIPTRFGTLDVSAKTDHGVVILNYKLLCDGDFFKDYSYLIHEYTHWADQCLGEKPTQSSDVGNYLDNPHEEKGFQNQVEYIANHFGEQEAEEYVDDLLEHHDVQPNKQEDKKEQLMAKV